MAMSTPDDITAFLQELNANNEALEDERVGGAEGASDEESTEQDESKEVYAPPATYIPPELVESMRLQAESSRTIAASLAAKTEPEKKASLYDWQAADLTDEEREAFEMTAPTIKKIAQSMVAEAMKDYQAKVVEPLYARVDGLAADSRQAQTMQANTTLHSLTAHAIPNYQEFTNSKTWTNYLDSQVPNAGGMTYRDVATQHIGNNNLSAVAGMMLAAKNAQQSTNVSVAPGTTSVGTSVPRGGARPKALAYSKYGEAKDLALRGKMTQDDFAAVQSAYERAAMRGMVDYNA